MNRNEMINRIGSQYLTANIEEDEYSYIKEAGSREAIKMIELFRKNSR